MKMLKRICAMFLTAFIAASYIFSIPISADNTTINVVDVRNEIFTDLQAKWVNGYNHILYELKGKKDSAYNNADGDWLFLQSSTVLEDRQLTEDFYYCIMPMSITFDSKGYAASCKFLDNVPITDQVSPYFYLGEDNRRSVSYGDNLYRDSLGFGTLGGLRFVKNNDGSVSPKFYGLHEIFALDLDSASWGGSRDWERWYWSHGATGSSLYFTRILDPATSSTDYSFVDGITVLGNTDKSIEYEGVKISKQEDVSPPPETRLEADGGVLLYYIAQIENNFKPGETLKNYCNGKSAYDGRKDLRPVDVLLNYLCVAVKSNGYGEANIGGTKHPGDNKSLDNYFVTAYGVTVDRSTMHRKEPKLAENNYNCLNLGWACIYSISSIYVHGENSYAPAGAEISGNFKKYFEEAVGCGAGNSEEYQELMYADTPTDKAALNIVCGLLNRAIGENAMNFTAFVSADTYELNGKLEVVQTLQSYFQRSYSIVESPLIIGPKLSRKIANKLHKYIKVCEELSNCGKAAAADRQEVALTTAEAIINACSGDVKAYSSLNKKLRSTDTSGISQLGATELDQLYNILRLCRTKPNSPNSYESFYNRLRDEASVAKRGCKYNGNLGTQDGGATNNLILESILPSRSLLFMENGAVIKLIRRLTDGAVKSMLIREYDATVSVCNMFYGTNYAYYTEKGSSVYDGLGKNTVVSDAYVNDCLVQYKGLYGTSTKYGEGLSTLELRCTLIDYCQKYNYDYTVNEDLMTLLADTRKFYDNIIAMGEGESSDNLHDFLHYGVFTGDYMGDYYAYQVMLATEIAYYEKLLYNTFAYRFLGDAGFDVDGLDEELGIITVLYRLSDHYAFYAVTDTLNESLSNVSGCESLSSLYSLLVKYGLLSAKEYTQDIYDEGMPISLFWENTSNGGIKFSYNYLEGRALSATYIPLQTNTYDPYAILNYADLDWIENFHYKYGFHRKALLIDTNPDAAMDYYTTKSQGSTRVATLQDLLSCEKDIVLYVDENFYNIDSISEKQGLAYNRLTSEDVEKTKWDTFVEAFVGVDETDPVRILKHAEIDHYSRVLGDRDNLSDLSYVHIVETSSTDEDGNITVSTGPNPNAKKYDSVIMDLPSIRKYLIESDEYSDMMSYAFVSCIYRDFDTFNNVAEVTARLTPVLVSSSQVGLAYKEDANAFGTLLNYAFLKNLPSMATVGYETSADMTSPVYVDIYGNIVTESGLVVVPAACNLTLHDSTRISYEPICSGYLSTYGQSWKIPIDWDVNEDLMSNYFYKNPDTEEWDIKNRTISGISMDFSRLSYSEEHINQAFKEWYQFDITNSSIVHAYNSLNVLHETMRGAPLDCIDFDAENLNLNRTVDKSGLIAAAKLDSIINSLEWDTENSIMSIPSLSFIDNYQYVVVFVFKILLVIVVTALMITVYVDAMKSSISGKTVLKCLGVLLVGVSSVLILPVSYELSYYQSNKVLLQDEAEYIMMLNTEKNMSGREIGVYQVTEPEQTTQVLLKLEDYKFDWISELPNVIFSDSIDILDASYQEFLKSSALINNEIVQVKNDGTYMDVQNIFDTSVLNFSTETKNLYQKVSVDPVASYYTPYYYFLDALLNNMNNYNSVHNIYAYSTKMMRGGQVKTVNLCSAYFNSPEFQDVYDDLLGLYQIYEVQDDIIYDDVFDNSIIEPAKSSQWYVGTFLKEEEVLKRLDLMTTKAQEFVVDNRDLIGKVTDETFLKCMAMSLAIDYNQLFGIPSADALEIYNLSNADLIRLTVADRDITLEDSPMSFARFVYNEAGTPGVYASVFLVITTMFVQTMKTVLTIGIFIILLVSVFVLKILLRKQNHSFAGYLLTLAVICGTNILYALIIKVSLFIPTLGIPPTVCIILQVLIQLGYLFILGLVFMFALRDWRNGGFNYYSAIGGNIKNKAGKLFNRFRSNSHGGNGGASGFSSDDRPKGVNGWKYLERLQKQQEKREKKAGR